MPQAAVDLPANFGRQVVSAGWEELGAAWDRMYPLNPIRGDEGDDDGDRA